MNETRQKRSMWDKPPEWDALKSRGPDLRSAILAAAPTAFKWIEWSAVLALLRFAELKTELWAFTALQWLLGFLLWGYFMQKFTEPEFEWLAKAEMFERSRVTWWVVSTLATAGMVFAIFWLSRVFLAYPLG